MFIRLKTGREDKYSGDFDLSANDSSLIIARQDNFFETYNAEDIAELIIQNGDEHKVSYKYVNFKWQLQSD